MAITYDEDGTQTTSIAERKKRLAQLPEDFETEREILDARTNKKAQQDAGYDMLLDAIKKSGGKGNKKGRV